MSVDLFDHPWLCGTWRLLCSRTSHGPTVSSGLEATVLN